MIRPSLWGTRQIGAVASKSRENYQPVIGLEVHVQLATKTKLFSRAPTAEEAGSNSRVAPFDMAIPGTLPRLNKSAVMLALRMASLLNCEVPQSCRFDRKHYFYADMPAGYQITQSDQPIAKNGRFKYFVYNDAIDPYSKEADIQQLQLEQDSGKTIHHGNVSLIDLNRAGIALVEVVTTPCFSTALEAVCFIQQLRLQLMHHLICDGELHKGHMRVDANVSLSQNETSGVRTEIKNMNSLRHLHTAVNYEIDRQFAILSSGGIVVNETRACDQQGRTVSMRDKEEETDYRMLPEPNLPTLRIQRNWIAKCKSDVASFHPLYMKLIDFGFDPRASIYYAEDELLSKFVSNCIAADSSLSPKDFPYWLKELKLICQRSKGVFPPESVKFAKEFVSIIQLYANRKITKLAVLDALRLYSTDTETRDVSTYISEENLWRIVDDESINKIVKKFLIDQASLAEKARSGNSKALSKLRTKIVEDSNKRVDVFDAERLLRSALGV